MSCSQGVLCPTSWPRHLIHIRGPLAQGAVPARQRLQRQVQRPIEPVLARWNFQNCTASGGEQSVLWVRFKRIKQDARIERPSARESVEWLPFDPENDGHGRDWVPIGDVPTDSLFSISFWYKAFVRALGRARSADEPMTTFVTCINCGNRWKC